MTATVLHTTSWYVDGLPAQEYHACAALSSSGARDLLRTPALYRWRKNHPIVPTREMELGTCVHTEVLGTGQPWQTVPFEDWRSKAAAAQAAALRADGEIPVKPSEAMLLVGMAMAVLLHPLAGPLLEPDHGVAERALFWRDEATGVDCRALVDFSPHNRRCLVDLKTTGNANPAELPRHMARYGYPIQAAWYLRGARALGLADDTTEFVWVFVEREPPHLVTVCRLPAADMAWADGLVSRALETYRDCAAADVWPGYSEDLITVGLPGWARREYEERTDEY